MSFQLKKIKDVGKVFTGKTPSKVVEGYFGGDIPFVTPAELDKEQFVFSSQQTLTQLGADQIKLWFVVLAHWEKLVLQEKS